MKWNNLKNHIDYTNIQEYKVTDKNCEELVLKARVYDINTVVVSPASLNICIPHLKDTSIKLGVSIAYPAGTYTIESKVEEIMEILEKYPRVEEFYVVMSVGMLINNKFDYIEEELTAIVDSVKGRTLKLITEISILTEEQMEILCNIMAKLNIEYIVSSTAFAPYDVPFPTVENIAKLAEISNGRVKIIASGNINSIEDASKFINAGADRLCINKDIWMEEYYV